MRMTSARLIEKMEIDESGENRVNELRNQVSDTYSLLI